MIEARPSTDAAQTVALRESTSVARRLRQGSELDAGDTIDGRYVLVEPLGQGGMGVVWRAYATKLDVDVAVKLVRSREARGEALKRMAREARAAARLGHPAVARVLDFGCCSPEGDDPYVVMELLSGESLGEVLDREGRIEPERAVSTVLPLIDGLREAHDQGIIHRDIKPENLFIARTARGFQPKVLDFGIAKLDAAMDAATKLTQAGTVLGSPGYFSPEQARGQTDLDSRTDIWSVCVVLYELITGELPFLGPNYNALLAAILNDTPKSITTYGYGDHELWTILERGLARDRARRWQSMSELGRALAHWLWERGVQSDMAACSLRDIWLDQSASGSSAKPLLPVAARRLGRHVLSTLTGPRGTSDTLGGETVTSVRAPKRLPAQWLGFGAATLAAAIGMWAAAGRGSPPAPDRAPRPATAPGAATQLSLPAPVQLAPGEAAPESSRGGPEPARARPPRAAASRAATPPPEPAAPPAQAERTSNAADGHEAKPAAPVRAKRQTEAKRPAPSRRAARATRRRAPRPRRAVIDQEFGF